MLYRTNNKFRREGTEIVTPDNQDKSYTWMDEHAAYATTFDPNIPRDNCTAEAVEATFLSTVDHVIWL